ncbi:MAG TPA: transcription antitermination factor NusB [Ignavibacteria bacterium]|nr:transcription antitermination factor NusB [Ignavibacteria bacterium]HAX50143.1 transcription antitermination factor NusB [Bacteroidota bacterium]HRE09358.1 transcription antitermination factor NusB [Ignavibacteria bacterium]HRF64485.1 transcription antitermination factor NusB [Ignavibacteria bacterium]HRJ04892.1 transcription antitermination factor NusB [Ignavibacteria bacterium]
MALTRRHLREKSLQVLYAYKLTGDPIDQVKQQQLEELDKKDDRKFCEELIKNTIENDEKYEAIITATVDNWDMERIALIDSIIIKMCLTEFFHFEDIPPKVSINESIDIAKDFSTRNSGKFVNGVLDAILEKLQAEKLISKKGKGLISGKRHSVT